MPSTEHAPGLTRDERIILSRGPLLSASAPGGSKFESFRNELRKAHPGLLLPSLRAMVPEVIHQTPEIEEDEIKGTPPVGESEKRIAVLKAHRGNLAEKYRKERMRYVSPSQIIAWLGGSLSISYGNDVVSGVSIGGTEWVEFKPPTDATKEEIGRYLNNTIGERNKNPDGKIVTTWRASLSLHEAKTDVGVVRRETYVLESLPASEAFLNALLYGLYDPAHPVNALVAWQFMNLYTQGTSYSRPNSAEKPERHKKNWGDWTPETGMSLELLRGVNAGKKGDSIPFTELLLTSVNGIHRDDPRYPEVIADAIKAVRGKPRRLHYALRRLIETIAQQIGAGLNAFQGDPEFVQLASDLRAGQKAGTYPKEWNYTGRTIDISGELRDIDESIYIPFVLALLGMPSTDHII